MLGFKEYAESSAAEGRRKSTQGSIFDLTADINSLPTTVNWVEKGWLNPIRVQV